MTDTSGDLPPRTKMTEVQKELANQCLHQAWELATKFCYKLSAEDKDISGYDVLQTIFGQLALSGLWGMIASHELARSKKVDFAECGASFRRMYDLARLAVDTDEVGTGEYRRWFLLMLRLDEEASKVTPTHPGRTADMPE